MAATTAPKRILVIEDNEKNRKLFELIVRSMGYKCLLAVDGEEGIRIAAEAIPDLILMDIQLPHMDGVTAFRHLQQGEGTKGIPVAAVTSFAMKGDRERLLAQGFSDYLAKPIDVDELRRVIGRLLEESRHGE